MKKLIFLNTTTSIVFSAWMLFGIYKYCSSNLSYWNDLRSGYRILGELACNISAILSVAGAIMSSLHLKKYGICKLATTNIVLSWILAIWLTFPVLYLYFGSN